MTELVILLAVIGGVLFVYVASGVKVIRPYERGIVERLGRYKETTDPGLRIIFPVFERIIKVDMREQVVDVPPQEVITKDNVIVTVDAVVYYEPTDPQRLVYNVAQFILAATKLAQTNLRNVVGDMDLDGALTSRDTINVKLREVLDEATDKWGVRIVRVEIQRIDPPHDVMTAMHEQMKAERTRRAVVTEAQGGREAAITRAEGDKQAAILQAEGLREASILEAEGARQAAILEAEGEGQAIETVFAAWHRGNPTSDVLALKYFEALEAIADGRATKIVVPAELSGLVGAAAAVAGALEGGREPVRAKRSTRKGPGPTEE